MVALATLPTPTPAPPHPTPHTGPAQGWIRNMDRVGWGAGREGPAIWNGVCRFMGSVTTQQCS